MLYLHSWKLILTGAHPELFLPATLLSRWTWYGVLALTPGARVSSGRFVEIGRSKVVGLQVRISASSNEVSSVRLKPGSQGWYEGISMNDWMKKWCVFYDSHWVTFVFAIQSAWIVSTGKDYNAWLRFRKLFHTKEHCTKEFEVRRWHLLDLGHAEPLSIQKKDWRRLS